MQKDPKMRPNKSSAVKIPVISSSAFWPCAVFRNELAGACSSSLRAAVSTHSRATRQCFEMATPRGDASVARGLKAHAVLEVRRSRSRPARERGDVMRGGPNGVGDGSPRQVDLVEQ
jgi:hypothetical protein